MPLSYAQDTPENTNILECPRNTKAKLVGDFFDSRPWKMGPVSYPETSVRNYHYSLRNIPEEGSTQGPDDSYLLENTPDALL